MLDFQQILYHSGSTIGQEFPLVRTGREYQGEGGMVRDNATSECWWSRDCGPNRPKPCPLGKTSGERPAARKRVMENFANGADCYLFPYCGTTVEEGSAVDLSTTDSHPVCKKMGGQLHQWYMAGLEWTS